MSWYNTKNEPKKSPFYVSNELYFFVDQYQKDTCFYDDDAYYYYDIYVDRIPLYKKSDNEYFFRYNHLNKMDIATLQLKIKHFYYEICDYDNGHKTIYIENSDKEFFEKMREICNKVIELININHAPNFVKNTLDDNSEFIEITNFIKSNCYKNKLIIVLHSIVINNLKASLLEVIKYEY